MHNAYIQFRECSRQGISLTAKGNRLIVESPDAAITPELEDRLIKAKPELLSVLTDLQGDGVRME
jgi:hypothetical protein